MYHDKTRVIFNCQIPLRHCRSIVNDKMKNSIIVYLLAALVWTSILMEMVKATEVNLIYQVIK